VSEREGEEDSLRPMYFPNVAAMSAHIDSVHLHRLCRRHKSEKKASARVSSSASLFVSLSTAAAKHFAGGVAFDTI